MLAAMDMNVEKINVERQSLGRLMWNIAQGIIRIPRFQREFVWSRNKIIDLLDSMYKEYPIGTIFLWEAPTDFNHMLRTVSYLQQPKIESHKTYSLILDGQQRLTSLYAVVNGLEVEEENYGKIVFDLAADDPNKLFRYRQPDNKRWVAVQNILKNDNTIYDGLQEIEYRRNFNRCSQLLNNYPFSTVVVKDVDIDDAIEIFERINRAGKRLTRYDLITASVLTDDFDLRERTEKDIITPLQESFGEITETSIPQTLALNIKGNTEHKTQMELLPSDVQPVWNDTVECFKLAVEFVKQNLGVVRAGFLPYDGMLPVLAHYFHSGHTTAVLSPEHKRQLEYWFWRTAFSERYSGASQTRMSEDAAWIRELIEKNASNNETITIGINSLTQSSMRSFSAMRNGILCILSLQNPLHFRNGSRLDLRKDNYANANSLEKHHIFPLAFLEKIGHRQQEVHLLPNFCFLPSEVSHWIDDKAPSDYMQAIHQEFGQEHFEAVMASHLIPVGENSGIWSNNYERFLRQRGELLLAQVRELAGISDSIAEEQRNPLIDTVETALRDLIHDQLIVNFGLEYWNNCIPRDVNDRVEQLIERESRKLGVTKSQFDEPRSRLDFCDTTDYLKIITKNWREFSGTFKSKNELEAELRHFSEFRNAVKHNRTVDILLEHRARAATIWLARALDLDLSSLDIIVNS
ncbi:MAG TPA: DUF262 domain-containing protein [Aggregatilinea sp.]|uniref:GmrSD restriction endonuclease domain-containing protein n=1 Tax=Aggregatilinea sp. TaxID=2806333 RepID=UPI002BC105B5|nr:DUF262 domain-containing protein [Aggregatilinea sp.]HML22516.1 DUF262 domain-containing protein [Aggregatilinea sp.]